MVQAPPPPTRTLNDLVEDIQRYEAIVEQWDTQQQQVVLQLKQAIEALHKEALTRLIRSVKQEAMGALRNATQDDLVYGLLRYHDLVKAPSLQQRLQQALDDVRPGLQGHQGDIELVSIRLPDTVEVRLVGACSHCPASQLTLSEAVEIAIKRHCPEIEHVVEVAYQPVAQTPEALPASDWRLVTSLAEIPEQGVLDLKLEGHKLLLSRQGETVQCFRNACSHLGVPIDGGECEAGILTCPYHGFQFELSTGNCLTAPAVPLQPYPVQVRNGQVFVRLEEDA
ncbi:MAG: Rieske 2Fe-2S domain-containing protein [Leptolyngbya sp. SIO1D8]|nr:Rieske 2Fe-2S domain-containing protein [Leptolyngbya sp. SIO1D8]